jgi:serine/threonine-protein kinase
LLYVTGTQTPAPEEIVWVDRAGRMTPVDPGWVGAFETVALSPDGDRLAVAIFEGAGMHLWVKQLPAGPLTRLTFEGQTNYRAAWTPDGRSITFVSDREGNLNLMRKRADGSAAAEVVLDLVQQIQEGHFSSSGEWLVYRTSPRDIYAVSTTGDTVTLVASQFEDRAPALSPDEHWLAYISDESGRYQVYVRPFPETGEAKWQVSTAGGSTPRWAPDGRTLYYRSAAGEMIAVDLPPSSTFVPGERRVLFQLTDIVGDESSWDVSPDGERFVMIRSRGLGSDSELIMVENFFTELNERVR